MNPKQYFRYLVGIFCAMISVFLGFVVSVDPYNLYDVPTVSLTANKYMMNPYERTIKPVVVARLKPHSVILGTSRSAVGLDPIVLSRHTKESAYNFGINGSAIDEIATALRVAVRHGNTKHAVFGIDYLQFNDSNPAGARQLGLINSGLNWNVLATYAEMTASLKAVFDAGETVVRNALGLPPSHSELGHYIDYEPSTAPFVRYQGRQALPTEDAYQIFDDMMSFARAQKLRLHIFVSPTYLSHLGIGPDTSKWADRVSAIAWKYGYRIDRIDVDASFTARRDDYWDPSHYRPALGNRILQRLFANNPV